ncbi:putative MAM and LDL-receptor class A domain-containing protein 1-like [Apostichopus japonicus]|uniref:Putative MAM and LDL-receptor class A domain-containing protein 1-like n=1 Tax=Stichopus japonicus TaxID=307972 RepID=A0A2G8KK22_STIJA|nr:putative MAM and LDL-receptor class A domain-containing protein 1-like [Apostichopus japonicus]
MTFLYRLPVFLEDLFQGRHWTMMTPSSIARMGDWHAPNGVGCYPLTRKCDFVQDCSDGSDETECGTSCDFESGRCGWKNSAKDTLNWIRDNGDQTDRIKTGPTTDHTTETELGYITNLVNPFKTGINNTHLLLESPWNQSLYPLPLVPHGGSTVGTLNIFLRTEDENTLLFTQSGSQGNQWQFTDDLTIGHRDDFEIIIEAIRGLTITGDIAIDDVLLENCNDGKKQSDFGRVRGLVEYHFMQNMLAK